MGTGMIGMQWIIFIGVAVVSWLVQMNLQNKFKKYSQIPRSIRKYLQATV